MFANAQHARNPRSPHGGLYHDIRLQTGLNSATPHELIAMLFDAWMESVARARGALHSGDNAVKGQSIGRAVRIIEEGLQAGLNLEAGGTLARDLNELYSYLTRRLTLANLHSDDTMLEECQRLLRPLQEAWAAIAPNAPARR